MISSSPPPAEPQDNLSDTSSPLAMSDTTLPDSAPLTLPETTDTPAAELSEPIVAAMVEVPVAPEPTTVAHAAPAAKNPPCARGHAPRSLQ